MRKRKVNDDSVHNNKQRLLSTQWDLRNEGKSWSDHQIDNLLDTVFVNELAYESRRKCLVEVCMRSPTAIKSMLHKLFVRYGRENIQGYNPVFRRPRLAVITGRDLTMIHTATSVLGRKNGAHAVAYICKITNHVPDTVEKFMSDLGTLRADVWEKNLNEVRNTQTELTRAVQVYAVLCSSPKFKRLMKEANL